MRFVPPSIIPMVLPFAVALLGSLASTSAEAATCTIVGVDLLSFGNYDVFDASPLDTAGDVTYHCTDVGEFDSITVDLDEGNSSSYGQRELQNGAEILGYNIYLDAARTSVWGDGTGGTSHHGPTVPPESTNVTVTAYGRLPALQDVPGGSYSDTIIVTINY